MNMRTPRRMSVGVPSLCIDMGPKTMRSWRVVFQCGSPPTPSRATILFSIFHAILFPNIFSNFFGSAIEK